MCGSTQLSPQTSSLPGSSTSSIFGRSLVVCKIKHSSPLPHTAVCVPQFGLVERFRLAHGVSVRGPDLVCVEILFSLPLSAVPQLGVTGIARGLLDRIDGVSKLETRSVLKETAGGDGFSHTVVGFRRKHWASEGSVGGRLHGVFVVGDAWVVQHEGRAPVTAAGSLQGFVVLRDLGLVEPSK